MKKSDITRIGIQHVGMVWYRREDYDAILRIMSDRQKLPGTFHEWLMKSETREKLFRREGKIVVRAFIDPETFPDWCRSHGLDVDAQARMQYASRVAYDTVNRSHRESGGVH